MKMRYVKNEAEQAEEQLAQVSLLSLRWTCMKIFIQSLCV